MTYVSQTVNGEHLELARQTVLSRDADLIAVFRVSQPVDEGSEVDNGLGDLFGSTYLLITDKRLVFWTKGNWITDEKTTTFFLEDVRGVERKKGSLVDQLTLVVSGRRYWFAAASDENRRIVEEIENQIQAAKREARSVGVIESIPDQIKKLAELERDGVISSAEFGEKKAVLLQKMSPEVVTSTGARAADVKAALDKLAVLAADGFISMDDYRSKKTALLRII